MSETEQSHAAGSVISQTYELVRLIGRGGMGEVWLANHMRLPGKQVAVKFLKALNEDILARFKREAEIASRLRHPNIVEILDYNVLESGAPYLVLELLVGESLAVRLARGPLSPKEADTVVRQVGLALNATHAKGIIHRDLKPDNIFLHKTETGEVVKVLDFGISKIENSATMQTQETALLGTPQYMSPEQALGKNTEISAQTDIFALGVIAYEMLSGGAAFVAENLARIVYKVVYEEVPPLQGPQYESRHVDAIVHALRKDKTDRTASASKFVEEFTGRPITVSETTEPEGYRLDIKTTTTPSMAFGETLAKSSASLSIPIDKPIEVEPETVPAEKPRSKKPIIAIVAVLAIAVVSAIAVPQIRKRMTSTHEEITPAATAPVVEKPVTQEKKEEELKPTPIVETPAKKPTLAKTLPIKENVSEENIPTLADAQSALARGDIDDAIELSKKALPKLKNPRHESLAHAIAARAYCAKRDVQNAVAQMRGVSAPMHKMTVRRQCKKLGIEL